MRVAGLAMCGVVMLALACEYRPNERAPAQIPETPGVAVPTAAAPPRAARVEPPACKATLAIEGMT